MKRKFYINVHKNHLKDKESIDQIPEDWNLKPFDSLNEASNEIDKFRKNSKVFKKLFKNEDAIIEIDESE